MLVVGGGIAGLTAAIGLKRANVPVTVLEQAPRLKAMGGAIQIWANGMHAMRRLGIADRIETPAAMSRSRYSSLKEAMSSRESRSARSRAGTAAIRR